MARYTLLAPAIAVAGLFLVAGSSPAEAARCFYRVQQHGVGIVSGLQGEGTAVKLENACDRARRECNRKLDRARKRSELPRGSSRDFRCIQVPAQGGLG